MSDFQAYQESLKGYTKLSKYITEQEFIASRTAVANRIDNRFQNGYEKTHATFLCKNYGDVIRKYCNAPLIVTSGFRCEDLNTLVGGHVNSKHRSGLAMDFYIRGWAIKAVFDTVHKLNQERLIPKVDKCIYYPDKGFVHLQIQPEFAIDMESREQFFFANKGQYNLVYS